MTLTEYADSSYEYGPIAVKMWQCPRCKQEFLFTFRSNVPGQALDLECPSCGQESPIPWPTPPMVTWTCGFCGHVQKASRQNYSSRDKKYTRISLDGKKCQEELRCNRCLKPAGSEKGMLDIVVEQLDAFPDKIRKFLGVPIANPDYHRENLESAKRARREFDDFLKKVPEIRAERARLAEEKRQRIAKQVKAREEELRLLKKQAKTAIGLKRMKPTNFELTVASLYLKLGYKVYTTPVSGDQGIDIIAIKDKQKIAVQCKRYKKAVPVSQVRDFYGSFVGNYTQGVFVTSSVFSKATRIWAKERQELELLNGQQFAKLFVKHNPKIVRNVEKWKEFQRDKEYADN